MAKPLIAIVGRPNVGKSMLFNKLIGKRLSIVEDTPGVTRDRIYGESEWLGRKFRLVDTGGIEPSTDNQILSFMREQAQIAIDNATVIVFVTDIKTGMTAADQEVAGMLQRSKKPIVLAVNKMDATGTVDPDFYEFYNLGLGDPVAVSAVHGHGTGDLLDECLKYFPTEEDEDDESDVIQVAIIGKPNAGKSSLLNLLAGSERAIVTELPGTTRDVVSETVSVGGLALRLLDTAGLRDTADPVERIGVQRSRQAAAEASLLLAVFDASRPWDELDDRVLSLCEGREALAILNKTDLPQRMELSALQRRFPSPVRLCAATGEGLPELERRLCELYLPAPDEVLLTSLRHAEAAGRAREAVRRAREAIEQGVEPDIAEVDLREAIEALGEITGESVTQDVINSIFSRFCVGK